MILNNNFIGGSLVQRRNTTQRLRVLGAIEALGHTTSEELIAYMSKNNSDVSLATIYRNLAILIEDGQVRKLELGDSLIYETVKEKHYHFVCLSCRSIYDVKKNRDIDIPTELKDFQVVDDDLTFFGYCKSCKKI